LAFNAPKPAPYFDGDSVAVVDGVVWSAVSFVEGETVGWSAEPTMFELGAFLGAFHAAAALVEMETQQSPVFPIAVPDGHDPPPAHVIHGDFTNHNVLVTGSPAAPTGVIDFGNAYIEVPLFDMGAALWRSGRPSQEVDVFAPQRIVDYVDGYSSRRPVSTADRAAIPAYLEARGLQIIAKQAARGVVDDGPRRKLAWLRAHHRQLVSVLIP
jgi:Ser/Thr protein kinase RdoA (MazF antagonist)